MIAILASCSGADPRAESSPGIRVVSLANAPVVDTRAAQSVTADRTCTGWKLDAAQASRFFSLAKESPTGLPHEFDTYPCAAAGKMVEDGVERDFLINSGGHALVRDGERTRIWICEIKECAELPLLLPAPE